MLQRMRNDGLRSDLAALVWWQHPVTPGVHNQRGERRGAHVTSTMGGGSEGRGEIARHSEPLSYTTLIDEWPLWCDDPQNRSKWEHGNRISIYLFLRTYSRVTSNWMWKGFIPVWQRRYSRIKIPSQWVIIIHTLNSVREDQTFDSQQTVCTEVFILSQCTMSDLFASFDRQLAHHFLYMYTEL